eukprot:403349061
MDFKSRFQGKTSNITKYGDIAGGLTQTLDTYQTPSSQVKSGIKTGGGLSNQQQQSNKVETITLNNPLAKNILLQNSLAEQDVASRLGNSMMNNLSSPLKVYPYQQQNHQILSNDIFMQRNGQNMAEILNANKDQQHTPIGFAERLRKNKESVNQSHNFSTREDESMINGGKGMSEDKLYSANPFPGLGLSESKPIDNNLGQNQANLINQSNTGAQSQTKPLNSNQLRQSVEKSRASNFGNVSKQILNVKSSNQNSISQQPLTQLNKQQAAVTSQAIQRQNSYINKGNEGSTIQQNNNSSQPQKPMIKTRAASVSNPNQNKALAKGQPPLPSRKQEVLRQEAADKKFNDKPQQSQQQSDNLFDMYGQNLKQQTQTIEQQNLNSYNPNFPFMQSPPTYNPGLSPDQLQQQILMMQHQMMLLQQQQQMFLQGQNQGGQISQGQQQSDIYKQMEDADKNFKDQQQKEKNIKSKIQSEGGTSIYQPYSVKDYKHMQQTSQSMKLGGLGANIGSADWEKAKKKQEQAYKFAEQIKLQNAQKPLTSQSAKKKEEKPKEKTAREKALEFAKNNVPKPKVKSETTVNNGITGQNEELNARKQSQDLNGIEEEEVDYDEFGNTIGVKYQRGNEFDALNQKHDEYANEIEKIKQMLM